MAVETTITLQPATKHLVTLRADMLAGLRFFFPEETVPTVVSHDGDFGPREIETYSEEAPALVLVVNGGKPLRTGGSVYEKLKLSLFIITKGDTDRERTDRVLLIYEHFLKLLFDTDWNSQECVGDPEDVDSMNLYGEELDEMGIAIWAVKWVMKVQIPYLTDEEREALPDFATLFATYTNFRPTELPGDTEASEQAIELDTTPLP